MLSIADDTSERKSSEKFSPGKIIDANFQLFDGVGDLLPGNTFRAETYLPSANNNVSASVPDITFYESRKDTKGNFTIVPSAATVSAKVDTEIFTNESITDATARLLTSAEKTDYCFSAMGNTICFTKLSEFDINDNESEILDADSLSATSGKVDKDKNYILKLAFSAITPNSTFVHYQNSESNQYGEAYINDIPYPDRHRVSPFLEYFLVPLKVTYVEEPEEDFSELEEEDSEEEQEDSQEEIIIPKAPNTGRARNEVSFWRA